MSYIGRSDKKRDSLLLSVKFRIQYLRSLEDSERVRKTCLAYMQAWYGYFFPERPEDVAKLHGSLPSNFRVAWSRPACAGNTRG